MKIKNWNQFIIRESFALSKELFQFIKKWSLTEEDFLENLEEVKDIQGATVHVNTHIVDEKNNVINVELEEGVKYKFNHTVRINYVTPKSCKIEEFFKIQENLNTISTSIQEMISRISEKAELKDSEFQNLVSIVAGSQESKYYFSLIFQTEVKNIEELKKSFDQYLQSTKHTPQFNKGLSELTKYFQERGITLHEYLDTLDDGDFILVGFVTEDEIYGIGLYNKQSKNFTANWTEVENAIEAWMEEN